ncbi:MAG: hypothetical protein K8H90_06820 [Thermoanaerobaculia bacterium]|nr:hypothetical protein [Thermoanaerobaculia bacterium]
MRVMVKATRSSEAGFVPNERLLADMGRYNEELDEEALEWVRRCPDPMPGGVGTARHAAGARAIRGMS